MAEGESGQIYRWPPACNLRYYTAKKESSSFADSQESPAPSLLFFHIKSQRLSTCRERVDTDHFKRILSRRDGVRLN